MWMVKARGLRVQDQPGLPSKTLLQKKKKKPESLIAEQKESCMQRDCMNNTMQNRSGKVVL
jgi:hypothetical protein